MWNARLLGATLVAIGERFDVHWTTVAYYLKKYREIVVAEDRETRRRAEDDVILKGRAAVAKMLDSGELGFAEAAKALELWLKYSQEYRKFNGLDLATAAPVDDVVKTDEEREIESIVKAQKRLNRARSKEIDESRGD